jgi:cytochrome c oxidase subunit 1
MSETTPANSHAPHHASHEPPKRRHWLLAAGWPRAAWMTVLFFLLGMGIVVGLRALGGYDPALDWEVVIVVGALTMAPLGFLSGLGAFDYWVSYAIGRPTTPEDHSSHGAYSWKDYFRVNTDHKVIGIQYVTTTIFFFLAGGLLALLVRAELARPETDFVDTQTYNQLFTVHASLMIFLFIIPAFAGLANFVLPLMIGAPDMAFPRLNALSYWLLPIAGIMLLTSFFFPGVGAGWTNYAPLAVEQAVGNVFFSMAVQ